MTRIHILALIVFFIGTTSVAIAKDYTIPNGVTVLTEKQLLTHVIGNTMTGGNKWFEYFEPFGNDSKKGRLRGKGLQAEIYEASWEVHKSLLCLKFDDARRAVTSDGCYTIALDGNEVTIYKDNGYRYYDPYPPLLILSGNPKNL
jgi:hypothetical protein